MVSVEEVKRLEGWFTFEEAGHILGYTKQGIHRLVFDSPRSPFNPDNDVRGVGARPLMLLSEESVVRVKAQLRPENEKSWGKTRLTRAGAEDVRADEGDPAAGDDAESE